MEQFTMILNDRFQRPIICLNNWHGLNALLGTGALFPVWTASEKVLSLNVNRFAKTENFKYDNPTPKEKAEWIVMLSAI